MTAAANWLRSRAENVAVGLLTAMFVSFILQIFYRYVVNEPLTWTLEACLLTWLWLVFWGAAFLLRDGDHVRFDILYASVGSPMRRLFALISALAIIAGFVSAFPATYDFISFMSIESSSSLGIRLDHVFAAYLLFAVAVIVRYALRTIRLVRGMPVDPPALFASDKDIEAGSEPGPDPEGDRTP
jgi:TRAP-type C4-dicarboxylate transport system permease small subunit